MQPGFLDDQDRPDKRGDRLPGYSLVDNLFQRFDEQLWASGSMPAGGQIVDAGLINVAKKRNTRDENKQIKECRTTRAAVVRSGPTRPVAPERARNAIRAD